MASVAPAEAKESLLWRGVFEGQMAGAPINTAAPLPPPAAAGGAGSRRHAITALGFLACMTMEVARSFSVVVIPMAAHFGWGEQMVGKVLAASFYGYTPMQIPSGLIAHRFGSPRLQVRVICLYPIVTSETSSNSSTTLYQVFDHIQQLFF
jgi:hypothetical protein